METETNHSRKSTNDPSFSMETNRSQNSTNDPSVPMETNQSQNATNDPSVPNEIIQSHNGSNVSCISSNSSKRKGRRKLSKLRLANIENQSQNDFNGSSVPNRCKPRKGDKFSILINRVRQGHLGNVVVFLNESQQPCQGAYEDLENSFINSSICISVNRDTSRKKTYVLKVGKKTYAQGKFKNLEDARRTLAKETLEKLKAVCFVLEQKSPYTNVTNEELSEKETDSKSTPKLGETISDKAHKMMLKMGWSGKGLGASEQGVVNPVTVYINNRREGVGSPLGKPKTMKEITDMLGDFSRSDTLSTLSFHSNLTKEDWFTVDKLAFRFNLKLVSKDRGKSRTITVSRRKGYMDLVRELLEIGGENEFYRLHVPTKFKHLSQNSTDDLGVPTEINHSQNSTNDSSFPMETNQSFIPRKGDKISTLIYEVQKQGPLGSVIVLHYESQQPLQEAYRNLKNSFISSSTWMSLKQDIQSTDTFVIKVGNKTYASGNFKSLEDAKRTLAMETLEKLKATCFFLECKSHNYANVTIEELSGKETDSKSNPESTPAIGEIVNDIAHKIMLKMGWSGKGLGASEKGKVNPLTVLENIGREGFGSSLSKPKIMREIMDMLDDFSRSDELITLSFNSNLTEEERDTIDKLVFRLNLELVRDGKGKNGRITVSRKVGNIDLIRQLLEIGGEDEFYRLHVPTNYKHLLDDPK